MRGKAGFKGVQLFCSLDNPYEIFYPLLIEDKRRPTSFYESENLKKTYQDACGISKLEIYLLDKNRGFLGLICKSSM
jgi:hypothetical protein